MKKLLIFLLAITLFGCAESNADFKKLDEYFSSGENIEVRHNNFTEYFDYYVPSDVVEEDFEELSFYLKYNNSYLAFNINVPSIIASKYYNAYVLSDDGYFDENKLVYSYAGKYVNYADIETDFFFKIFRTDNEYILYLKSKDVCAYGYCVESDVIEASKKMLLIASEISIKNDLLINKYSSKDIIDYEKEAIELFDSKMPETGTINDLIVKDDDTIE